MCDGAGDACSACGLDIALGVTDCDAVLGQYAERFGGVNHRRWVRFGVGERIAADDDACTLVEAQSLEKGRGEASRLIGDDAPWTSALLQCFEQLVDAIEGSTGFANTGGVVVKKGVSKRETFGGVEIGKSVGEHRIGTMRDRGSGSGENLAIASGMVEQTPQCSEQIRRAVDQRPVEIEDPASEGYEWGCRGRGLSAGLWLVLFGHRAGF